METYFKITSGIVISVILCLLIPKEKKDISVLLCIAVCCMALAGISVYIEPLIELFVRLTTLGNLPEELVQILLKTIGIGLVSQLASVVCIDAGNQSLSKAMQIITSAVILWLCIPLLERMLVIIENVLGGT